MSGPRDALISLPGCAGSVDELLVGVESREPLPNTVGKSGATLERVVIDGRTLVLKHLRRDEDWTMRAAGVLSGATSLAWSRGLFDRLPPCFAPVVVGVALTPHGCAILMHDVQRWLVPAVDDAVPLAQHRDFLNAMAALHAAFWEVGPDAAIVPEMHRYLDLSPWTAHAESRARLGPPGAPADRPRLAAADCGGTARRGCGAAAGHRSGSPGRGPCRAPRGPSCTATGSWTIWAPTTAGAPSCSTGSCPGSVRRCQRPGLVPGDQLPAAAAVEGGGDRGLPGSARGHGRRHRRRGGTASSRCACSVRWCSSAGRRRWRLRRRAGLVGAARAGRRRPAGQLSSGN